MNLEGIHHVTCITADAPGNVEFYARVLGLRMVKKTVNFDAPEVYHLYYADERATPGAVMTFFEFPGALPGRAGAGMIHTIQWRVKSTASFDVWERRLQGEQIATSRTDSSLRFCDPEGLQIELVAPELDDWPLQAQSSELSDADALCGFHGVRAYARPNVDADHAYRGALGFELTASADGSPEYRIVGESRQAAFGLDPAPAETGVQGSGTVHHVAWASHDEDHIRWREHAISQRLNPTPVIDRQYFNSIYFREPNGVLFEIATLSPGFAIDEAPEHLGEALKLPPQHEPLRKHLERSLKPLNNPRVKT